jgi:large subunit ribosomal protein L25
VQSIPEQLIVSVEGAEEGTQITADKVELPDGVTLVSDPETLVVNIVSAPSSEELESEGGGASLEEQAAEVAEAEAEASDSAEESAE